MPLLRDFSLIVLACSTLASCKDREPSGAAGETEPVAVPEPLAEIDKAGAPIPYFLRDGKLLRIIEGQTEPLVEVPKASYCETDSLGQAIWLLSPAGISVFEPESRAMELVVAAGNSPIKAFEVRFGIDQGEVGNADPLLHDVALIVVAAKRNSVHSEIICEGEREALCYVETHSDDPDMWELQEEAALLKSLYDQLTLSKTELLTKVATRRRSTPGHVTSEAAATEGKETPLMQIEGALACGTMHPPAAPAPTLPTLP